MSKHIQTITVEISLSDYGDALIYGSTNTHDDVPGLYLKQRLFAWHEASFYGTDLTIRQVQNIELVVLPAELVIPFFADPRLLGHIEWVWSDNAAQIVQLAPLLDACIKEKKYVPSFSDFQDGKLKWIWDEHDASNEIIQSTLDMKDASLIDGLRSAFSAAVFHRWYGTETAAADLRSDYPLLFARNKGPAAGLDARAWLVAIGWKDDTAPFRPVLQLLEPEEDIEPAWRLQLVLQDKHDAAVLAPIQLAADGTAAGSWPAAWSPHVRERSTGWLERLRACLPAEQFTGGSEDVLNSPLNDEAAWQFLTASSNRLLEAGWQVLLPAWWEAARRKQPRLRAKVASGAGSRSGSSLFGLDSIIDFDWRIAIGEADLTEAEFAALVARNERLVRFKGQWIQLDPELLAQIRRAMASMDKTQGLSFQDVLQLHLLGSGDTPEDGTAENSGGIKLEVELNEHMEKLIRQLGRQSEWPMPEVPAGLRAELRPYQLEGYAWLAFLRRFGLGACLADDMGLGKTVQLIAYLLHLKEHMTGSDTKRPSLIICPTSVLGNWQKELSRFAPSLDVMLHYGSKRLSGEAFHTVAGQTDVVLTSFATSTLDQEMFRDFTWAAICLDEAQNIKNAQTKQSSAIRSFPSGHRIALTGTPIENRLSELWSIYDFIIPGYLGSSQAFHNRFSNAIEKERDEKRTADLQKLVKPFMLRRKKKDPAIQLDLPDKNEMKTYVHLTAEQGALYEQTVNQLMERVQKLEGIERKGAILSALTQLKQLCNHPMLITKEALPEPSGAAGGRFDSGMLIDRSSKLERLLAMVKELREEGERCLIFTQYIGMGQLLQQVLRQELQEPVLYLNGSTSKSARDRMIEQFQSTTLPEDEQPSVFILSLKAGGVGLNLTAANHVFHFDRWWNPAVENQATDRAYRMGQTRDVQVHKFISLGTLEERIDEMLENKQQLSDNVISSSEGWITELSTDALRDLFTLRQDWMD
ncbi:DEAD/DEAH box helicase [Paenibacillus abyssi]|uniref:ATP-dependent helicase YwqA n=1 Tax=Paenibacillus abyssi TaxID=1340531 RepID=A0A917D0G1_9BACL|nr:DEAD/DEAH box helicase [Paenibacillus abyssi]GGG05969.1 putative ATP-dependent helicase YwqA [Paenibacillus abyssi]